jgi:serine/threonine protein kinase
VSETFPTSLKTLFDSGVMPRLAEYTKLTIVYEILSGLSHMHELGLIHRNLRPSNVLLDAQGSVKLADFGLFHATDAGCLVSFPIG